MESGDNQQQELKEKVVDQIENQPVDQNETVQATEPLTELNNQDIETSVDTGILTQVPVEVEAPIVESQVEVEAENDEKNLREATLPTTEELEKEKENVLQEEPKDTKEIKETQIKDISDDLGLKETKEQDNLQDDQDIIETQKQEEINNEQFIKEEDEALPNYEDLDHETKKEEVAESSDLKEDGNNDEVFEKEEKNESSQEGIKEDKNTELVAIPQNLLQDEEVDLKNEDIPPHEEKPTIDPLTLLPPDHPLLKSAQDALKQQLEERLNKLQQMSKEYQSQLKHQEQRRQQIGVQLYNAQHQLSKLQSQMDQEHEEQQSLLNERNLQNEKMNQLTEQKNQALDKFQQLEKQKHAQLSELQKLNNQKRLLTHQKTLLNKDLTITQRQTQKIKNDLKQTEKNKVQQDFYLDRLEREKEDLEDQYLILEKKYQTEKSGRAHMKETLMEAQVEMETILFEKRRLLGFWKGSLVALAKKDAQLLAVETKIKSVKETMRSLEMEKRGLDQVHRQEEAAIQDLQQNLLKSQTEQQHLTQQLQQLSEHKDRLYSSFKMYSNSLEQTNLQTQQVEQKIRLLQLEVDNLEKEIHQQRTKKNKTEQLVMQELQKQVNAQKQQSGTKRDHSKIQKETQKLLEQQNHLENQLSLLKVEQLSIIQQNKSLEKQSQEYEQLITKETQFIQSMELDMKKKQDDMSKRQSEMDFLNRKLEKLMDAIHSQSAGIQGEIGPLEATIHSLQKSIQSLEKEGLEKQQYWMRAQNELVALSRQLEEGQEELMDYKMKQTVLERKRMVLNSNFEKEEQEMVRLQKSVYNLRRDMERVQLALGKHQKVSKSLQENKLDMEMLFRGRLKEAEMECAQLEQQIGQLNDKKQQAIDDLFDAEQESLLWHKKFELAKKAKKVLNPSFGQSEVSQLEMEIHRMEVRYEQLEKLKEQVTSDIQKSIMKHSELAEEAFHLDLGIKNQKDKNVLIKKQVQDLKKRVKQMQQSLEALEEESKQLLVKKEELQIKIKEMTTTLDEQNRQKLELTKEIEQGQQKKKQKLNQTIFYQTRYKRYQDLMKGQYKFACKDPNMLESERDKQNQKMKTLLEVIGELQKEFPKELSLLME